KFFFTGISHVSVERYLNPKSRVSKYIFNTMTQSRVSLDVQSYNIMINDLCKSKMVDDTLNLFEKMRRKDLVPDTETR
ncbi:hypothetical protein HN51_070663, partial [Arachis hypogaea]